MNLLTFALALTLYFALHSLLAAKRTKTILTKNFIPKKYYRLLYNASAIGTLIPIFYLYQNTPAKFIFVNVLLNYIGLGILILGIVLLFLALRQYNLSEFAGFQQLKHGEDTADASLKISGFNAVVRHPLYFAGLLIIWGFFIFRPTDLFLVVALVSTLYLYVGTKLEEQKLVEEFGKAYQDYQKKVPMLIPFLK